MEENEKNITLDDLLNIMAYNTLFTVNEEGHQVYAGYMDIYQQCGMQEKYGNRKVAQIMLDSQKLCIDLCVE